jgi:ubiquinone/menaquinone biosynthesis C-methylase UbiE
MDNQKQLTERQKREKEYYDQYAKLFNTQKNIDFSPVTKVISKMERRPWNSYWTIYEKLIELYQKNFRLLDFGTGPGENALRFSEIKYQIDGFDISENNIMLANKLFEKYERKHLANFQISSAENLPYENEHFDVIVGIDILHHVDIEKSLIECKRVLKTGGTVIFREPLEVPFLDFIRNLKLVKLFAPKEKSFDLHITEDERKLNQNDVKTFKKIFPNYKIEKYLFLARFDKFLRKENDPSASTLEKIDFYLFKLLPFLQNLGGVVVLTAKK